jgi:hypothetical protein
MSTDLLQSATATLAQQLKTHASRSVRYRRGHTVLLIQAVVGRTQIELSDELGAVQVQWTDRDFLISAEDLVINGQRSKPQAGDRIEDGNQLYEVLVLAGEPQWRYCDPYGLTMRIHTKLVAVT